MQNLLTPKAATLLLIAVSLNACVSKKPLDVKAAVNPGLVIGNPINYYDDSTLLFPVGCDYKPTNDNLSAPPTTTTVNGKVFFGSVSFATAVNSCADANGGTYAVTEYSNFAPENFDMRNLLFMNKFTRRSYPLCDSTLHILSFEIHKEFRKPFVMYKVAKRDLNGDSLFTNRDIISVYFSNPDGSNFRQITPDGEDFHTYFVYPETNTLLFKTYNDSNNDKTIATGDESNFYEVDLHNPQMGRNIFPDSLRARLKTLI
jgi:hypothetical protein